MNLDKLPGTIGSLSEANRPIRLRLSHEQGVLDDVLLVKRVTGTETLCGGLEYRLLCVSTQAGLPLKEFIALPIELQFVTDRRALRSVCGIVSSASEGQGDGGLATYQLIVRDALALMEQRTNTRVFQGLNEVDVILILIDEWRNSNPVLARAFDVDMSAISDAHPKRQFIMQSNESDAAFVRRLLKQRGIAWFMRPGQATELGSNDTPAHTLVLFDSANTLDENVAGSVRYHRGASTEERDVITGWTAVQTLKPGRLTRQSWDYKVARMSGASMPSILDQGTLGQQFAASLDDYVIDVPHAGDNDNDYRYLGNVRMQRHEYEAMCFYGESDIRDLYVGQWNGVSGHPEIDSHPEAEREFVITELHVDAENNLPKDMEEKVWRLFSASRWDGATIRMPAAPDALENGMRYSNRFTCVRRGVPIVPSFDPRVDFPPMHPMTAIVVCGPGLEIDGNELGCVKIRIPGCRIEDHTHAGGAGASNTNVDSAWVRVSSPWASANYGLRGSFRANDEVLLDFLGGDPSKPIVTGAVHGGKTPATVFSHTGTLPGNQFLSGIVSQEIGGVRSNQLRLDDTPAQISAQLASEHGHSELNLGYLTHPRNKGRGNARGEGAEIRSDKAVTVRGAQGVLIAADASLRAKGKQLDRAELIGMNDALHSIYKTLSNLAAIHFAGDADGAPLAKLIEHIREWEKGSNTEGGKPNFAGGKPIVAVSAPEGIALTSQDNVVIGARTSIDVVSAGNTQHTAGGKVLMRAEQGISLFTHKHDMQFIAASGKIEMQAQDAEIVVGAAKRLHVYSLEALLLEAPEVVIRAKGVDVVYRDGKIVSSAASSFKIESPDFTFVQGSGGNLNLPSMPHSTLKTDEHMAFAGRSGQAREKVVYKVRDASGAVLDAGQSGADGATKTVVTDSAIKSLRVHIGPDAAK